MKKQRFLVWGCAVAGCLWALAGLRDVFAPGFFSMNGRAVSGSSIAVEFGIAAMFLIIAAASSRRQSPNNQHQ